VGAGCEPEVGVGAAGELLARAEAEGHAIGVGEWGGGYRHKTKLFERYEIQMRRSRYRIATHRLMQYRDDGNVSRTP
jgi:hypothetical protein